MFPLFWWLWAWSCWLPPAQPLTEAGRQRRIAERRVRGLIEHKGDN